MSCTICQGGRGRASLSSERALRRRIGAKPGSAKVISRRGPSIFGCRAPNPSLCWSAPACSACGESFGAPPWSGAIDPICHLAAPSKSIETYWSTSGISERSDGPRSRRRGSTTAPRFRCSGSAAIAKSPRFWGRRGSRMRRGTDRGGQQTDGHDVFAKLPATARFLRIPAEDGSRREGSLRSATVDVAVPRERTILHA